MNGQAAIVATPLQATAARPGRARRGRSWLRETMLGLVGLVGLFLLWYLATDVLSAPGSLAHRFSPVAAVGSLPDLVTNSDLPTQVAASLARVSIGLGLAIVTGIPLGLAVGSWRPLETATAPVFQLLRMTSPLSWMPIAVMVFGLGDRAIDVLLAFAATWPIALSTAAGVRALDARWLLLGRSLAATRVETLLHIVLPGVVAHVLTGIRLAIGIAWIVLVPCEMLGVSSGLGYLILNTRDALAYSDLMGVILVIGVCGFVLDALARLAQHLWRQA